MVMNVLAHWVMGVMVSQTAPIIDISGANFQTLPLAVPNVKVTKGGVPPGDPGYGKGRAMSEINSK